MFNAMNENEMMTVNGGFYYVPAYKNGKVDHMVQVASGSGITCYLWNPVTKKWVAA